MEYEKVAQMPCLHGLHLRSSVNLVKLAQAFSSEIRLRRGRCEADAKGILGVLAMGVCFRAKVRVQAHGEDAKEAVAAVASYLDERANCFD